jgi:hypothetical protein
MNANVSAGAMIVATSAAKPSAPTAKSVAIPQDQESTKAKVRDATDNLDLSEGALALQSAQATQPKLDAPRIPVQAPRSQWDQDKLDQIDRLEVLLHQGQYKVEPFMVDEIALRLARFMVVGG